MQHDKVISNHVSVKKSLAGVWKGFEINTALILTHKTPIMTKCTVRFCDVVLEFQGENILWYFIWIIYQQTIHMKWRSLFGF